MAWARRVHAQPADLEPESTAAVAARLRVASSAAAVPAMLLGGGAGLVYSFLVLTGLIGVLSPAGTGLLPGLAGMVGDAFSIPDPIAALFPLFAFAGLTWLSPRAVRWIAEGDPRGWSRRLRGRKLAARSAFHLVLRAFAILTVCAAIVLPWQWSLLLASNAAVVIGGQFIAFALIHRRGRGLVCSRCEYPMCTWRGAAGACSECGQAWKAPYGVKVGLRRISWRLAGTGLTLLACATCGLLIVVVFGLRGL